MKFKVLTLISLAAAALLCGCKSKTQTTAPEEMLPKVRTQVAHMENVPQQMVFTGTVEAFVKNDIAPQVARRISTIRYDVGDHVNSGDVLVTLDASYLVQAKAQLENAKKEYERTKELYEYGGASRSEWDSRRLQYEVAQATYDNLMENTTLRAPITGVVSARNYDVGDMTGVAPVLVVEQIKPVKIKVGISERLFKSLKRGMNVYLTVDAYNDEKFTGSVTRIYPTIDPSTHTFVIEISLPNLNERLRPGMFGRVTIPYGMERRIVVSDLAVQKLMGSADRYVYIFDPETSTVRYSKVEYGQKLGDRYEILSGISEGEQVVVEGQLALKNGLKVELNDAR